jgi:hypothetical protein
VDFDDLSWLADFWLCYLRGRDDVPNCSNNQGPEWRSTLVVCQQSGKKPILDAKTWLPLCSMVYGPVAF